MYRIMGIPATRYDREVVELAEHGSYDLSEIILWVGVDAHAVDALVNGASCIEGPVRRRLQELLADEEISIRREYAVTASVTVSCTVHQTVEAQNMDHASDLMHEMITDGEIDDLFDDFNIDDIHIEDVEAD